jgi:hypothetical protein
MKKLVFLLSMLFALITVTYSQTVENIRVEQEDEKLLIHYRIGGSTSQELYDVTLTCRIDNGQVFEPVSVIGDVGTNIRGGKSFNTIVWDVFEDVEEIGNIEFFVEVDLIKDEGQKSQDVSSTNEVSRQTSDYKQRHFFLAYSGTPLTPLGGKFGYLKNWGVYGAMRFGYDYYYDSWSFAWDEYFYNLELVAGIAKQTYQKGRFRSYIYGGIGYCSNLYEYYDNVNSANDYTYTNYYTTFDVGSMAVFGILYTDLGFTVSSYHGVNLLYGVGLIF